MATRPLRTLAGSGAYFESPRWRDGRWWVSDFYRQQVFTVDVDGTERPVLTVQGRPAGLGWLPDGSLLVVSMLDRRILRRRPDGTVTVHADVAWACGGDLNDMVVDRHGRAYAGNYGFDVMSGGAPAVTNLVRVDPDGTAHIAASDLLFPNGAVITPDGGTLIVGETFGSRYTAFSIAADGTLGDRRIWAQLAPAPPVGPVDQMLAALTVAPDGCTLDALGHLWVANPAGGCCLRVAPDGRVVDDVQAPDGLQFFACALGGADGRTLLICAAPDFLESNRTAAREAVLLVTTVDVPAAAGP